MNHQYPPQPPPHQPPPQHDAARGHFDLGGGHQLRVKIDGKTPEDYAKAKVSSAIWGLVIGAVILGLILLVFAGVGIYVYVQAKDTSSGAATKTASAATWDGKSTFECKGNDAVALNGVTANVSGTAIKASSNCQLTLVGVDITAPVGLEVSGNAKVTMTGGKVTSSTSSVVASARGQVTFVGTKVSGPVKKSGAATVTGAN